MGTIQLIEFPIREKMDSTISLKTKIFMGQFEWIINGILFQNKSIKAQKKKINKTSFLHKYFFFIQKWIWDQFRNESTKCYHVCNWINYI